MNKWLLILPFVAISLSIRGQSGATQSEPLFPRLFLDTTFLSADYIKSKNLKIRNDFSVERLPVFCKIEHNISNKTRFPVKIRLGSVDYVDKLEGKNNH